MLKRKKDSFQTMPTFIDCTPFVVLQCSVVMWGSAEQNNSLPKLLDEQVTVFSSSGMQLGSVNVK